MSLSTADRTKIMIKYTDNRMEIKDLKNKKKIIR